MSELLFECYGIPSVAYGIDGLFSAHHNFNLKGHALTDSLVVSSGHQTTHILPVLNGELDSVHCKRYVSSEEVQFEASNCHVEGVATPISSSCSLNNLLSPWI